MHNYNEKKLIASMLLTEATIDKIDGTALGTSTASIRKSRAITDSEGLSRDLGLSRYSDGTDVEKVLECLRDAQSSNVNMQKCYLEPRSNDNIVSMQFRNDKNTNWKLRFVELTLIAAERSGRLQLNERAFLRRGSDDNSIEIFFK
jgi:hypothetical protein